MLIPLFNRASREFKLPEDGWFQLARQGEFPHAESGLVQVIDEQAIKAMVNRFQADPMKPLLVDFDHFSYDPDKSSEAAGWIEALANREGGLWAQVRWTPEGEAALKNGRFRFISPVWLPSEVEFLDGGKISNSKKPGRIRPLRLDTAGLTNNPNLKGMVPLANRRAARGEDPREADATRKETRMKSVATELGLSADASEEAVLAEVRKLRNRATTAEGELAPIKNRVTTLETQNGQLLEAQVESDLAKYSDRIAEDKKPAWKKQLLANRSGTLELLESIAPVEAPSGGQGGQGSGANGGQGGDTRNGSQVQKPMHNRAGAKAPGSVAAKAATAATTLDAKRNNAVKALMNRNKTDWETAWNMARSENPELFEEEPA